GGGVSRHHDRGRHELHLAPHGDLAAVDTFRFEANLGPEMLEQAFGMVAARLAFDHGGFARRGKTGEQYRRLDLRRGDGRAIDDRDWITRAGKRDGQAAAVAGALRAGADACKRLEDALHGAPAQARVAVEGRADGTAADRPHDEAAAGAGIAEVEHANGRAEAADADAMDAPGPFTRAFDLGPERTHSIGGVEHVLAFEQPGDAGLADRERAEDQRPVRDRFVAGHARGAFERARAARGQRR